MSRMWELIEEGNRRRFILYSDGHLTLRCPNCDAEDILEYLRIISGPEASVEVRPCGKR
jgi:hypothetical protein